MSELLLREEVFAIVGAAMEIRSLRGFSSCPFVSFVDSRVFVESGGQRGPGRRADGRNRWGG